MKRLSPLMRLALLSIAILMIFGTISIIRGIIMLVLPLLRSVIGGELSRFWIPLALVLVLPLVSVNLCAICATLDKAGKEVLSCVDVAFLAGFLGVCFGVLLAVLVGVMFAALPGCVEASGFEFYFDDVFPIGHAD